MKPKPILLFRLGLGRHFLFQYKYTFLISPSNFIQPTYYNCSLKLILPGGPIRRQCQSNQAFLKGQKEVFPCFRQPTGKICLETARPKIFLPCSQCGTQGTQSNTCPGFSTDPKLLVTKKIPLRLTFNKRNSESEKESYVF